MSDRRYYLNKKALATARVMGKDGSRQDFMFVGNGYAICQSSNYLIRIGLPDASPSIDQPRLQPSEPRLYPAEEVRTAQKAAKKAGTLVEMPEGIEAKPSGKYNVPAFEFAIPKPEAQTGSITVDARKLIELLKAACEVTEHSSNLVRLRFCSGQDRTPNKYLRLDAHRLEGDQEFTAVLGSIKYDGTCIPGDLAHGTSPAPPSEAIEVTKLHLPLSEGRKFRHK